VSIGLKFVVADVQLDLHLELVFDQIRKGLFLATGLAHQLLHLLLHQLHLLVHVPHVLLQLPRASVRVHCETVGLFELLLQLIVFLYQLSHKSLPFIILVDQIAELCPQSVQLCLLDPCAGRLHFEFVDLQQQFFFASGDELLSLGDEFVSLLKSCVLFTVVGFYFGHILSYFL
jgi:hypothetical protein